MDGGRGSECVGRCGNVKEFRQVKRCKVVNGLEGQQSDFVMNAVCVGEPMEPL